MGCDIHMYREVQRNGQWECLEEAREDYIEADEGPIASGLYISRDYALFGLLAGVRWDMPMAFAPKNLPEDASPEIERASDYFGPDGHSHSWLHIPELKKKQAELLICGEKHAQDCLIILQKFLSQLEWPDDVADEDRRIVFWFDN